MRVENSPALRLSLATIAGVLCIAVLPAATAAAATKAFPTAEGFGADAIGGRGGRVIEVTNLNDSGNGSLRACVVASGPRTCVFKVAGYIVLNSRLEVSNPFLTIAGQTAPGGGITLRVSDANVASTIKMSIRTHDVIVRYIRLRLGTKYNDGQALSIDNPNADVFNVIIDHCSFSWVGDETVIVWYDAHHISLQWNNIAESLPDNAQDGLKGPNFGNSAPGSTRNGYISMHHNLLAHHVQRYPLIKNLAGPVDIVNNVMYNLGIYGYVHNMGYAYANLIGNYVAAGPNGTIRTFILQDDPSTSGMYHADNLIDIRWSTLTSISSRPSVATPYSVSPVLTTTPQRAYTDVLDRSGADAGIGCDGSWFSRRDAVDVRIVQSVRDGTRGHSLSPSGTMNQWGYISSPYDVGGWPALPAGTACVDSDHDGMSDAWEMGKFGTLSRGTATDSSSDLDADGYTDFEEYLNGTDPKVPESSTTRPPAPVTDVRIIRGL